MNDREINLELAYAIGWNVVHTVAGYVFVTANEIDRFKVGSRWFKGRIIDYRDPVTIWPIAEKYGLFPSGISSGDDKKAVRQGYDDVMNWETIWWDYKQGRWDRVIDSCAARCVALAAIQSKGNRDRGAS